MPAYFQSFTQQEFAEFIRPLSRVRESSSSPLTPEERDKKAGKQARYRAQQIFHWVYQRGVREWDVMSDLSKDLRSWLNKEVPFFDFTGREELRSADGTTKLLWRLEDGESVESVIIPADPIDPSEVSEEAETSRVTACISSQVGCAMNCAFCLTGKQGFERNLEVHEIVAQVWELRQLAPLTNIVFMGMGEPLLNLEHVVKACRILLDQDGMNFSKRKVTVSTSGLVPQLEAFGRAIDVSLAVSLNATTDEQRSALMPVNRKWNLAKLLDACRSYPLSSHRRITFEYVLLGGVNDTVDDALRLVKLLSGIPSKVNLIAFNEFEGASFRAPTPEAVRVFQKVLVDQRMTAVVRASRGRDILAACGQLRSASER